MIEAVLFDMDGVLVDSEPVWERARKALFLEHGLPYPAEVTPALMGMNSKEWSRYLHEHGVPLPSEQIVDEVLDRVATSLREDPNLMPGASDVVRSLAARWPPSFSGHRPTAAPSSRTRQTTSSPAAPPARGSSRFPTGIFPRRPMRWRRPTSFSARSRS